MAMSSPSAVASPAEQDLRLACAGLSRKLGAGEDCRSEDFFGKFPELAQQPEAALELVYAEFVVREKRELCHQRMNAFAPLLAGSD